MELAELATETAIAIAKEHDWQKLKTLATLTGDATTTAFDLPADYGRMLKKGEVHSSRYIGATFCRVRDEDEWILIGDQLAIPVPGNWIILGGQMQILPAMTTGETARFYYITKNIVSGDKSAFNADADVFLLSERVLTLGMIWRWRQQKRMEYAEDLKNYEIALSEEITADKGSNIVAVGRPRVSANVSAPYPGVLGP
jgi:hypothetical protein